MFHGSVASVDAVSQSRPKVGARNTQKQRRDPGGQDRYYQRKADLRCTTCGAETVPDRQMCRKHLDEARRRTKAAHLKRRRAQRKLGLCATGCGRRTGKVYRCIVCAVKAGLYPRSSSVTQGVNQGPTAPVTPLVESDGYARNRNRGSGKRGAPSATVLEAQDIQNVEWGIQEALKGLERLKVIQALDESALSKHSRYAARHEALARVALGDRLLDETLDRNKHGQECTMKLMTREQNRRRGR